MLTGFTVGNAVKEFNPGKGSRVGDFSMLQFKVSDAVEEKGSDGIRPRDGMRVIYQRGMGERPPSTADVMQDIHVQKLVCRRGERLRIQTDRSTDGQRPRIATRTHRIRTFEEFTTRKEGDVKRGTSHKDTRVTAQRQSDELSHRGSGVRRVG